ncbi:hypothetical protein OF83DRAFT_899435 [Amylostereum chailletii]|nr:hypothetical protein OF83DRAFT_899435 [Amylostereum chailletii]
MASTTSSKFVVAPQPRTVPPIHPILLRRTSEDNPVDPVPRIRSSPPKLDHRHEAVSEFVRPPSSVSSRSRDGRCSPLFGLRIFGGGTPSSRGHSVSRSSSHKGKERATEKEKPVVSVPILRTRTRSRDGPPPSPVVPISGMAPTTRKARHGSFDFERINSATSAGIAGIGAGNTDVKRSASQSRAERHVRSAPQPHTHAHSQSASGRARVDHHHTSRRHVSPAHTPHDPPPSAHSQSTATTATTPGTNTAGVLPQNGGTGSWGRKNRTTGWVRAGMHPPFAFESATSGSGASNGRASPANTSDGRGKSSFDSRKERERAASAEHRENERSRSRGEGRWEAREVELGLGLTWAPSKIKVREWRSEKDREPERERHMREGEREARERLREFGYVGAGGGRSATTGAHRKRDREVTGRYKDVLGEAGFEAFKKYVRRFDAEIIPLEGSAGLLMRVRRLLDTAPSPGVNEREKREMLDDLMRIVRETES